MPGVKPPRISICDFTNFLFSPRLLSTRTGEVKLFPLLIQLFKMGFQLLILFKIFQDQYLPLLAGVYCRTRSR
jgi:hypothetical protein